MRILGLDYGTKNIGVAISDDGGSFAFPKAILPNNDKIFKELARIIHDDGVSAIVVGDPGENKISEKVKIFVTELKSQFGLEVILEKEFMTSSHVSLSLGKKPIARKTKKEVAVKRDDSAAALILQRYLDRK